MREEKMSQELRCASQVRKKVRLSHKLNFSFFPLSRSFSYQRREFEEKITNG